MPRSRRAAAAARMRCRGCRRPRNAAEIVEQAGQALAARELAVERRQRACVACRRRHRPRCAAPGEQQRQALRAHHARGPAAPMPAAVSIHCCERTAMPLSASASGGLRRAERSSERTASWCGASSFEPAHQHVEQPLARRLLGHVGDRAGQHLAVDLLDVGGEDRERRAELAAQVGERDAGALGDLGEADPLESAARRAAP